MAKNFGEILSDSIASFDYSFETTVALNAQTGMVAGENAYNRETNEVYSYDGTSWNIDPGKAGIYDYVVADSVERLALTGMTVGETIFQIDTGIVYKADSATTSSEVIGGADLSLYSSYDYVVADETARLALTGMTVDETIFQIDTAIAYKATGATTSTAVIGGTDLSLYSSYDYVVADETARLALTGMTVGETIFQEDTGIVYKADSATTSSEVIVVSDISKLGSYDYIVADDTARLALTGMTVGETIFQTDTGIVYRADSATTSVPVINENTSNLYGDGSDGDLIITNGNTVNLNTNQIYNYNTIDIQVGGTLSTNSTKGILQIKCKGSCIIDGVVELSNKSTKQSETLTTYILKKTLTGGSAGVAGNGGNSGSIIDNGGTGFSIGIATGGVGFNGYGGGGAGGGVNIDGDAPSSGLEHRTSLGGDGGNGGSPAGIGGTGGSSVWGGGTTDATNGGISSGGGAGAVSLNVSSSLIGGDGGNAYSNNGQAHTLGGLNEGVIGGAGGAGGEVGKNGIGILIMAFILTGSGTINSNGGNGGNGGNGTSVTYINGAITGLGVCAGGGGGAGAGGGGGGILLVRNSGTHTITKNSNGGIAGTPGTGGANTQCSSNSIDTQAEAGTSGSNGNPGTIGDILDTGNETLTGVVDSLWRPYTSEPQDFVVSTVYEFTHNLGLNQYDIESGRYAISHTLDDNNTNEGGRYLGFGQSDGAVDALQANKWDAADPTVNNDVNWQENTVKIYAPRSGVNGRISIIRLY